MTSATKTAKNRSAQRRTSSGEDTSEIEAVKASGPVIAASKVKPSTKQRRESDNLSPNESCGSDSQVETVVLESQQFQESESVSAGRPGQQKPGRKHRTGGTAPYVAPTGRVGRSVVRRQWRRRGFVPVSPGRVKLRHRILPRTVIGISFMLLSFAIGIAVAGAGFYAYYENRLAQNEQTVARFVEGFDAQFTDAAGVISDMRLEAINNIRQELAPLGEYVTAANGVITLPQTAGPSVWQLSTTGEDGRPVTGTAFALVDHSDGTAMITSYSVIAAATTAPAPPIEVVKDGQRLPAKLWRWDKDSDVALVMVDAAIPTLEMADSSQQAASVGAQVFAMSGVGGQGSTASPGMLIDQSTAGIQHTVPVGAIFNGGPVLTGNGVVLGMASANYRPFGVDPGQVGQGPNINTICTTVLNCAGGLGDQRDEVVDAGADSDPETIDEGQDN